MVLIVKNIVAVAVVVAIQAAIREGDKQKGDSFIVCMCVSHVYAYTTDLREQERARVSQTQELGRDYKPIELFVPPPFSSRLISFSFYLSS